MATTKRKVGRPSKYTKELQKKADEYLASCVDDIEEWHKTRGEKSDTYERIVHVKLPTIEGLAISLNVNRDTLYEWKGKHENFSDTLEKMLELQKDVLVSKSLSGEYNSTIAKLILSANHNMVEKKEVDVTTGGEPIQGFNYIDPNDSDNQTD